MTNADPTVVDLLASSDDEHSQKLLQYLVDDGIDVEDLGYEDVFTPLRAHHDEGLVLRVTDGRQSVPLRWAGGDWIVRADDDRRPYEAAIDPFGIYNQVQDLDGLEVEVEIWPDTRPVVDS